MRPLGRRPFLTGVAFAASNLAVNVPFFNASAGSFAVLDLSIAHTGEQFAGAYRSEDGIVISSAKEQIDYLLRDWRTGESLSIDPFLLDLLAVIARSLSGDANAPARATIYSGYRSPETNAFLFRTQSGVAWNSYHIQGQAVDFRFQDYALESQAELADALAWGGLGTYGGSGFLHLDTGPGRRWGSINGSASDEGALITGLPEALQPGRGGMIHRGGIIDRSQSENLGHRNGIIHRGN